MKKGNYYKICYLISILFLVGFPIYLIYDYITYTTTLNSAPFYLRVAVDSICFLLPAGIFFFIGKILKNKKI